jgi:integrase
MGYIQRRDDRPKRWLARYKGPDGRHHSKSFKRKVDAEKWLSIEEAKAHKGEWVDPGAGKVKYQEWSEMWLAGLHSIKPKTRAGYESLLRSRVVPEFGQTELRRITTASVRQWVASMVEEGMTAVPRRALQVLHASLQVAIDDGLIAKNPAAKVKAPRVEKRRQLFLTAFELGRLADEAAPYDTLVWFLGWSGLRWGEAVALRAGRVEGRRVRVEESATEVGGKLEWGRPKTHETRTVIIPKLVAVRLEPILDEKDDDELVFTAPKGGPLRHSNFTKRYWIPAVKGSEVPEGLVIHDLRDTAASLAISAGASIKAVQRMLGHASAAMTLDTYGSLFEEDLEALADRLDEKYG